MSEKGPTTIGRYEVRDQLGRGGMATVFLAWDPVVEREVAIKVLPMLMAADPILNERFKREARVIAALEHSAIIPVYDFGEQDGQPYLVMRHMPGNTLAEHLTTQGPMNVTAMAGLIERLAPALDYAHQHGIVHRDLKPDNILFDDDGLAYIADFGIAKIADASMALTGSGIVGTVMYVSPEQANGEKDLDGRSDLYTLGIILYEALTGSLPYSGQTPMMVAAAHIKEPIPDILAVRPDLSPVIDRVIRKALAKDREERYQTGAELAAALRAAAEGRAPDHASLPVSGTVDPRGPTADSPTPLSTEPGKTLVSSVTPAPSPPTRNVLPGWAWALIGGMGVLIVVLLGILLVTNVFFPPIPVAVVLYNNTGSDLCSLKVVDTEDGFQMEFLGDEGAGVLRNGEFVTADIYAGVFDLHVESCNGAFEHALREVFIADVFEWRLPPPGPDGNGPGGPPQP